MLDWEKRSRRLQGVSVDEIEWSERDGEMNVDERSGVAIGCGSVEFLD